MPRGNVKKVVADRGFGFIVQDNGPDVFFHHSVVANGGFEQLQEGDEVTFESEQGQKGPRATTVAPA